MGHTHSNISESVSSVYHKYPMRVSLNRTKKDSVILVGESTFIQYLWRYPLVDDGPTLKVINGPGQLVWSQLYACLVSVKRQGVF